MIYNMSGHYLNVALQLSIDDYVPTTSLIQQLAPLIILVVLVLAAIILLIVGWAYKKGKKNQAHEAYVKSLEEKVKEKKK